MVCFICEARLQTFVLFQVLAPAICVSDCCKNPQFWYQTFPLRAAGSSAATPAAAALGEVPFLAASGVLEASFVKCAWPPSQSAWGVGQHGQTQSEVIR
jgi:hypothetical protein